MCPKQVDDRSDHDLFRSTLVNLIHRRHEQVRLGYRIDWQASTNEWSPQFVSIIGRPALPTGLIAALLYLKHVYALSDEDAVERWSEYPYWQHFSGKRYFQHKLPCDLSSLVRWRQRIGQAGGECLLAQSIAAAIKARNIKRAREQLAGAVQDAGITQRQSNARVSKAAALQASRYAHARQYCRLHKPRSGGCAPAGALLRPHRPTRHAAPAYCSAARLVTLACVNLKTDCSGHTRNSATEPCNRQR